MAEPCGCVTTSSASGHYGVCRQDGYYEGFCWYHYKMYKGLISPGMPGRDTVQIVVKKGGVGRIFPVRKKLFS